MYSVQLPYALKNCLPLILSFGLIVPSSRVVKQNVYIQNFIHIVCSRFT